VKQSTVEHAAIERATVELSAAERRRACCRRACRRRACRQRACGDSRREGVAGHDVQQSSRRATVPPSIKICEPVGFILEWC
jgi:hypothetical protein